MFESNEAKRNNVSADTQLKETEFVKFSYKDGAALKVMFVGNSITRHEAAPQIDWFGHWGMAASCEENDYVHRCVSMIEEKVGKINFCVTQAAFWESHYTEGLELLKEKYSRALEFEPDILIIRIGENINRDKHAEISSKPYYDEMVKFFASKKPRQIIVTDNFWRIDVLDTMIKQVSDENGYTFVKLSDLNEDKSTMALGLFKHEGVSYHPSDYGMELIAKRIFEKVEL